MPSSSQISVLVHKLDELSESVTLTINKFFLHPREQFDLSGNVSGKIGFVLK